MSSAGPVGPKGPDTRIPVDPAGKPFAPKPVTDGRNLKTPSGPPKPAPPPPYLPHLSFRAPGTAKLPAMPAVPPPATTPSPSDLSERFAIPAAPQSLITTPAADISSEAATKAAALAAKIEELRAKAEALKAAADAFTQGATKISHEVTASAIRQFERQAQVKYDPSKHQNEVRNIARQMSRMDREAELNQRAINLAEVEEKFKALLMLVRQDPDLQKATAAASEVGDLMLRRDAEHVLKWTTSIFEPVKFWGDIIAWEFKGVDTDNNAKGMLKLINAAVLQLGKEQKRLEDEHRKVVGAVKMREAAQAPQNGGTPHPMMRGP